MPISMTRIAKESHAPDRTARHHRSPLRQGHGGWCKSWLFTRLPSGMGFVTVRATLLDDYPRLIAAVAVLTAPNMP